MKKFNYVLLIAALFGSNSLTTKAQTGIDTLKQGNLTLGKIKMNNQKVSENPLFVYPNPASKTIDIRLNVQDNKGYYLEIYDNLGMRILFQVWNGKMLDVSSLSPGVFLLRLHKEQESYTQKLIIER